ncbi:MAG: endolytic transglycosylase MltG [Gammaproteobacteria bacterium]|nr:endolytic transglycosylase MltG [Gammaproteobacteria bacterium]MDD9875578.1 endolytic transglycosylase MltG [Gammaproteobacteria bacterium]
MTAIQAARAAALARFQRLAGCWPKSRPFNILIAAALAVPLVAGGYYAWAINRPLDFGGETWVIEPGDTLGRVARQLVEQGVIDETLSLRLLARKDGLGRRVRFGAYRFPPAISLREFLHRIATGKGQIDFRITILEGWTFARMRETLRRAPDLKAVTAAMTDRQIMAELGHPELHPEGRFFPDTYRYAAGQTDLSVYRRAFRLMQERLAAAWGQRGADVPLKSKDQALIIASIIEKESQIGPEQRRIAGVFYNRLRKGMRLQTDPTVIYGLGAAYRGNITRTHLKTDTPYNTYTRDGLPPTPISLPGAGALHAAVHPAATGAYYFVAKGGGAHHFSATLDQHNKAVRRYARGRKADEGG